MLLCCSVEKLFHFSVDAVKNVHLTIDSLSANYRVLSDNVEISYYLCCLLLSLLETLTSRLGTV